MKRKTAHIQERFLNCLRIQIVPGHYEDQRIRGIVDFCKTYAFDNVMLMINAEEYNVGHMTKEEAIPWIETMKRAKAALTQEGITVSLNNWMELGHVDRGRNLRAGQDFVTMVDYNGRVCDLCTCPMDKKWLDYFLDFYEYLIRELEPETVWIEDDFRLHNHSPLEYGGCFCEHHMKAFNEELGSDYTREEFVDRLFRKKPDKAVQKAFLDVNRRCMVQLANQIGRRIQAIGLGTKVGLMSSSHLAHSMEGRDWEGIHRGLSQGGPVINRLHLPLYDECKSPKYYYHDFNLLPFILRGYLPEDSHILPELENAVFMTFSKDSEMLRFQVESSIPLELEGMTYDIFDFTGNGAVESLGYGPAVAGITDYLTAVYESGYSYQKLCGLVVPLDEKNAYNRSISNSFYNLCPDEFQFGVILQDMGLSVRYSKEKAWKNEIIVLAAGNVNNFSDDQLVTLFTDNHVILEGKAAVLLIERGLGHLIGASGYQIYVANKDVQSYEQIEGERLVDGIPGCRATAFSRTGNYVAIQYEELPKYKSRVFDYNHRELGAGMTVTKGHLLIPYVIESFCLAQLHPLRQTIVYDYVDCLAKRMVRTDYEGIYAYYSDGEQKVVILVNATLNTMSKTRFKLSGEKLTRICEVDRDGVTREKAFTVGEDGFVCLDDNFTAITTKTFLIETEK